jgi:hypothetical protein
MMTIFLRFTILLQISGMGQDIHFSRPLDFFGSRAEIPVSAKTPVQIRADRISHALDILIHSSRFVPIW